MSELPTDQPTTDLSWASTGGTKTAPSAGQKTDGWDLSDLMVKGIHNWLWDAFERFLTWLGVVLPRSWDDLTEGIDATPPGDLFMLEVTQTFDDDPLDKPSKHGPTFPITFICTDSRRLYYIQNDELVAATCRPSLTAEVEWSIDISSGGEDMGAPRALSCDGRCVALGTTQPVAENTVLLVTASSGAVARKSSNLADINDIVADSDASNLRAFIVLGAPAADIYIGTDAADPIVWLNVAGFPPAYITTTPGAVVTSPGGNVIRTHDKAIATFVGGATFPGSPARIKSDGLVVIGVRTGFLEWAGPFGGFVRSIAGSFSAITSRLDIDDRYVCTNGLQVFGKLDGTTIKTWSHTGGGVNAIASDGRYLWTNVRLDADDLGYLTALPLEHTPRYYLRLDGGLSPDLHSPSSQRGLATPIVRDTI